MLVHLPIGLWSVGTACDGLTLSGIVGAWPIGWLCLGVGLAAAVPTMIAGLIDFGALEETAVPVAMRHMALMGMAWVTYLTAFIVRSDGLAVQAAPDLIAMAISLVGFGLLTAGAWHGGQLVYGLGVGVDVRNRD